MSTATQSAVMTASPVPQARAAARRGGTRRYWIGGILFLLVAGGSAYALGWFDRFWKAKGGDDLYYVVKPTELNIALTEEGELKPKNSVELKAEVEGQSAIRWVIEESKRVQKGELLVELVSDQLSERLNTEEIELERATSDAKAAEEELAIQLSQSDSELKKAALDLEVAELELRQYLEGDFIKAKQSAEIDIQQSEIEISRKEEELRKSETLAQKGFVTTSKLEELRFDLQKAKMTLEKNKLAKMILLEYDRPKMEKQKRGAVDQARQALGRAEKQAAAKKSQAEAKLKAQKGLLENRQKRVVRLREELVKCKITAPVDGVVQYPSDEMGWRYGSGRIAKGEKVFEGQTLIVLPDTKQMIVRTRIHEADRHKVKEGLQCIVRVPAVPGRTFHGAISKIAKFADSSHRWLNPELKEHSAEVLLEETDAPLSPGDTAEVKVLVEDVPNVLAVPVQCVFSRGARSFVFAQQGLSAAPVEVKLGRASTTLVEVLTGLAISDKILMHANDDLLALLPAPTPGKEGAEKKAQPEAGEKDAPPAEEKAPAAPAAAQAPAPAKEGEVKATTETAPPADADKKAEPAKDRTAKDGTTVKEEVAEPSGT